MPIQNGRPGNDPRPQTPPACPPADPLARLGRKANLRTAEAVSYLSEVHGIDLSPRTLDQKRSRPGKHPGPPFHSTSIGILYPRVGLDDWAAEYLGKAITSTSQT